MKYFFPRPLWIKAMLITSGWISAVGKAQVDSNSARYGTLGDSDDLSWSWAVGGYLVGGILLSCFIGYCWAKYHEDKDKPDPEYVSNCVMAFGIWGSAPCGALLVILSK